MFKEPKALEYSIEIILGCKQGQAYSVKDILKILQDRRVLKNPSHTYLQKIMARLVKADIFITTTSGYQLCRGPDDITVESILAMCDIPAEDELLHVLCKQVLDAFSLTVLSELYE